MQRADVDRELEQDNAELRARYLQEVPTHTAADIHELMHGSKLSNSSEPASRWKHEKRVFAVRAGPARLFPRFQFADGYPLPVIHDLGVEVVLELARGAAVAPDEHPQRLVVPA